MKHQTQQKRIEVVADWEGLPTPQPMGLLHVEGLRGKEVFSFEYKKEWLHSGFAQELDPHLGLYEGPQYLREGKPNFGLFLDSSPDRWGRVLMDRREAVVARKEARAPRKLLESDYLLGVYDGHRMGALRFRAEGGASFLDDNAEMATPPWVSLRELEHASLQLEREAAESDPQYLKWLNLLMAPGSSLGGARPKASVIDPGRNLWIAKFPSGNDATNIGAWEQLAHKLAVVAGLSVSETRIQRFSGKHHTFLTRRFDRTPTGARLHFASAMTLLGYNDGASHEEGVSYLDLAEFILRYGEQPDADLEQLWRRIVFHIAISNCDDHLRNHGFMLGRQGWRLSPAYDLNPVSYGAGLKLNITEHENDLDFVLALEVAPNFRLKPPRANAILQEVGAAVANWRSVAKGIGIPNAEADAMAPAFRWP